MIHIITGEINSGKTTKLISVYNDIEEGDGFALPKIYIDGKYAGQKIVRLSTKEEVVFSMLDHFIPNGWNEIYKYYNYSFSKEGQEFLKYICNNLTENNIYPVFIDEIGPLELEGKGSADFLNKFIMKHYPLYLVIRRNCLNEILKKFEIQDVKQILFT